MSIAKVAISIESEVLRKLDFYVKKKVFKNRSQAIQESVSKIIESLEHKRLAEECAKLDRHFEQEMAEDEFLKDMEEWPKY